MPTYEYKCGCGHIMTEPRKMAERHMPALCPQCAQGASLIISAPHVPVDGIYSYAPNIGPADKHERWEAMMKEKKDG
jgi:putative FmdB family regulatory protein